MNVQALLDIAHEENTKPEIYYTLLKYFARTTQFLSWPFVFIFFRLFFKLEIKGRENLMVTSSPFIIISNHISEYDSFAFRLILGRASGKLPLRFMAVNKFDIWYLNVLSGLFIIDILYVIFGVFVVEEGRGIEKNLREAVRIIGNGGNVVIYPEGSITKSGQIEKFKLGAAFLAQKTQVPVIPISMKIEENIRGKDKFTINIGKPIKVSSLLSPQTITHGFQNAISDLYKN
ncbi:MAG: lysophospholipid acyltransferase family protein [Patescibacteria group bacterium]